MRLVEASAFLDLTLPLVRYRVHGIHRTPDGTIVTPNRIIAKVSREELAAKFFSPPPEKFLRELVAGGEITAEQAELAARIPMAQDITAEADSGGHTDNRPANTLFPTILSLASRLEANYGYDRKLRVGLAGGISTPASAASAFAMGAAYIMTGSVNQACLESGTSDEVREMLAETRQADVTMAPAADMFEMGVTVQVLKRGTMFPMRAAKLYELYRTCAGLDEIPPAEREKLEKTFFLAPLCRYLAGRPALISCNATRARLNGATATQSTAWRWSSAGTWGRPRTGPRMANHPAKSIIRSGAARPWGHSTNGPPAPFWSHPADATVVTVA